MNDSLIEALLFRSEDTTVDFKAEQYVITKLDESKYPGRAKPELSDLFKGKKSELLKDLLAMANAWRDGPAYILIGFKENKPHPPTLIGIEADDFHDDAALQQFVNSKVNGVLEFKYEVRPFKGKTIGIFTIPKQRRPVYAKENFGKVEANTVYVRRGSSTALADPAEIAAMGSAAVETIEHASVSLLLHNHLGEEISEKPQQVRLVDFGPTNSLPDYSPLSNPDLGVVLPSMHVNRDYWRERATWIKTWLGLLPAHITLTNNSGFSLSDCKLEIDVTDQHASPVQLTPSRELPKKPQQEKSLIKSIPAHDPPTRSRTSLDVQRAMGAQKCVARVDKILPGESVTVESFLALHPKSSGILLFRCRLLAHELKVPLIFERNLTIEANRIVMALEDLKKPFKPPQIGS